jgi:hypothetical protein
MVPSGGYGIHWSAGIFFTFLDTLAGAAVCHRDRASGNVIDVRRHRPREILRHGSRRGDYRETEQQSCGRLAAKLPKLSWRSFRRLNGFSQQSTGSDRCKILIPQHKFAK